MAENKMAKQKISFRIHPWHYNAIQEQIEKGKSITGIFEELLNEKFPVTSKHYRE